MKHGNSCDGDECRHGGYERECLAHGTAAEAAYNVIRLLLGEQNSRLECHIREIERRTADERREFQARHRRVTAHIDTYIAVYDAAMMKRLVDR